MQPCECVSAEVGNDMKKKIYIVHMCWPSEVNCICFKTLNDFNVQIYLVPDHSMDDVVCFIIFTLTMGLWALIENCISS